MGFADQVSGSSLEHTYPRHTNHKGNLNAEAAFSELLEKMRKKT